jgi:4-amino-4-deoxy-L-arabinose transferase-like glycosyltransferase
MSATTAAVSVSPPVPGLGVRRLWRGPSRDPAWARPAMLGLLAVTALLYLFNLSRNGYANDFYAAAVQAGTKSWKVFGVNSWSILAPEALEGVLAVFLLYAAVRRWFGPGAGLVAGLVLALTPAAALIFRFNNPDALLVLLMTASAYCVQRAIERDRCRWLVAAGLLLGFGFLAKMMQAFLVLPGFGLAYLWAGPARMRRRLWQVAVFGVSVVAGAGWWVAIAQLTPAADRPYFGGSTNNSILELALGYNGLGRLDGTETGSIGFNSGSVGGGGGPGGGGFGGSTGILRLFQSEFGGQVSWLIPAALISLGALLWVSRRSVSRRFSPVASSAVSSAASPVTRMRAFAAIWGGWLLVTGLVFSFMQGIIHPYYMVALGPAIGALVGVGAASLWQARLGMAGRVCAAAAVAVTAAWSFMLLDRTPEWLPWLRWVVLIAGLLGVVALFAVPALAGGLGGGLHGRRRRAASWVAAVPLGFALVAGLAGPLAYSLDTVNSTHTGSLPSAGPTVAGAFGGPGGGGGGFGGGFPGRGSVGTAGGSTGAGGTTGAAGAAGAAGGGFPGGGTGGAGGGAGGMGGLSGSTQVSSALVKLLEQDASKYKWIAATEGTQEAAPIELATGGEAVLAIGGFNGSDPAPKLAEFEALVAKGEIHYYVGRGSNSFGGGTGSSAITSWVTAHFTAKTVGGVTVYDLTKAK